MLLVVPYRHLVARSRHLPRWITAVSSEVWSGIGLLSAVFASVAGHLGSRQAFAAFLLLEVICDFNDGWTYDHYEGGIRNGYGLYLDHVLDAIAAACIAWGGYQLIGHGEAVVVGLCLYYGIAIHSWLYKITQITRGQAEGVYYSLMLSPQRGIAVSVDDLAVVVCVAVWLDSALVIYLIDAVLAALFVWKVLHAIIELRCSLWRTEEFGRPRRVETAKPRAE